MAFTKFLRYPNFTGFTFSLRFKRTCFRRILHSVVPPKVFYNMNTAYFQHTEGEDRVYITLNFTVSDMQKTINFDRCISEPVGVFMKRLDSKINTIWEKKSKKLKKKGVVEIENPQNKAHILLNNEEVSDNVLFKDILKNDFIENLKIKIFNCDYDVVFNSPVIVDLRLPENLPVGCFAFPETFTTKFTDIEKSEFKWFKSKFPSKTKTWEQCGDELLYKIEENDIEHFLKFSCTPKNNLKVGPTCEIVSTKQVRKYDVFDEIIKRHEFTKNKTAPDEFRIVSYNILADLYANTKEAKTQIFTFCDPEIIDFSYRKTLLDFELQGYNADILCLQECQRKFYNTIQLFINCLGYESIYHEKEGVAEGCLLCYNKKKFKVIDANQYTLSKELLVNPSLNDIKVKIQSNESLISRLNNLVSQVQVVVLESANNILVIGNVHFYFHPDADHIRLLQGIAALRILINTAESFKTREQKKVSILICGDFNSTPECGFHKLLKEGSVDSTLADWKSNENEAVEGVAFSHSLKMESCYDNKAYTNYIPSFKGCLDYIYFQQDHLTLKQTVPIPGEDVLSCYSGIPNKYFPSDHVALIADLKFNAYE